MKRRPLRGEKLVEAALDLLADWANKSPNVQKITVAALAAALKVTRQPIYNNGLAEKVEEARKLQARNVVEKSGIPSRGKAPRDVMAAKDRQIADMRRQLDGWIQRWATIEHNARMYGIDLDKILTPLSPPDRSMPG